MKYKKLTEKSSVVHIEFTTEYPKAVIPAKAGIQKNTLDAGSSPA